MYTVKFKKKKKKLLLNMNWLEMERILFFSGRGSSLHYDRDFSRKRKKRSEKIRGRGIVWMINRHMRGKCLSLVWLRREKKEKEAKGFTSSHNR